MRPPPGARRLFGGFRSEATGEGRNFRLELVQSLAYDDAAGGRVEVVSAAAEKNERAALDRVARLAAGGTLRPTGDARVNGHAAVAYGTEDGARTVVAWSCPATGRVHAVARPAGAPDDGVVGCHPAGWATAPSSGTASPTR